MVWAQAVEGAVQVDPQSRVLRYRLSLAARFHVLDGDLPLPTPQQVGASVDRYAIEPGREGRVALELPGVPESRDESFLGGVQCVVTIAGHTTGESEDLVL